MASSKIIAACSSYGDAIALEYDSVRITYRDMLAEAQALAEMLKGQQAVAICMKNSAAWVIADLACIIAEVSCVPLPPFFTSEQMLHVLRDAGISLILTDMPSDFNGPAWPWMLADKTLYMVGQFYPAAALAPRTAKITYTSGTTGHPKGVCLTQEAVETVATSLLLMIGKEVAARHLCVLPLAVLLENIAGVYTTLLAGGTCILDNVTLSPKALAEQLNALRAETCILVPELLRMLIAARTPLPHLRFVAVGGAKVDTALLSQAHAQGIPVYEGYGISENASVLTLNLPKAHKQGSVGKLLPHVEMKIEEGEILIRHPLFSGYLGQPAPKEEWYATGDLGAFDEEGYLFLEGRKRNVFITSYGRNVSPEWPESALTSHAAIAQAAVFGEAKPYAAAVIVPYEAAQVRQAIQEANKHLPDYARIGAYVLAHEPFSTANRQLTGNGRLKREAIYVAYESAIEQCYQTEKIA